MFCGTPFPRSVNANFYEPPALLRRRGGRALQKRPFARPANTNFINPTGSSAPARWGALRKRPFARPANANFYKSTGRSAPARWGAFQKRGISATFLSGTRGEGVAFAVMESRSRRFGVFLLFVLARRAVCRFKERQHRGQSGKQSVPAQKPPPIVSAVSCAAMPPRRTNGLNETPLPCHRFSKEPVPHHNSKNLRKQACHPDRLVQKPP